MFLVKEVSRGRHKYVSLLAKLGADLEERVQLDDGDYGTPLHLASRLDPVLVETLLSLGSNPKSLTERFQALPIDVAASSVMDKQLSKQIMALLLR